jgi:hypothetical protein
VPDIESVRNRRWLWTARAFAILLAAAAILLTIACGMGNDTAAGENEPARGRGTTASASDTNAPVRDYFEFARAVRDQPTDSDPTYVANGLRKMAAALATLNVGDLDLHVTLRAAAEHMLLSPGSTATTESVRSGLIAAANAIEQRGQGDSGDLRRTTESIRTDIPLGDQRATMREFFVTSADALERLSSSP